MKKTFLAILMILVLATAGLFAAVTIPGTITAHLNATIGDYLDHGFNNGVTLYNSTIEVENAFAATTPSFKYGFKTNAVSQTFSFKMTVYDFLNQSTTGTVKIQSVASSKGIVSHSTNSRVYEIFKYVAAGLDKVDETTITIKPFLTYTALDKDITNTAITAANAVDGAPAGDYVASISFAITAS